MWFVTYYNQGWQIYDSYTTEAEAKKVARFLRGQGNIARVKYTED